MTAPVISVRNLSKSYRIGHVGSSYDRGLRHTLTRALTSPFRRLTGQPDPRIETLWALNDVSFDVQEGEVLGIIGRNGAGKSTLLKILSRITTPTSGEVRLRGRVASLLEVGTGFHPELTGRENIFLNGSILGMTRAEVRKKFDEIVGFSEIEKFLDTPVKHYSSGMYVRLAFAVAAHLDPEILLVDEVLAVGDAAFQHKSLGKMGEAARSGRTVVFVSHNMAAVSRLCQSAILIEEGRILKTGPCDSVITNYGALIENPRSDKRCSGDSICELIRAGFYNSGGNNIRQVTIAESFTIEISYRIKQDTTGKIVPNFHFYAASGICCFAINAPGMTTMPPGDYVAKCHVPAHFLNEGLYSIGVACTTYYIDHYHVNFFEKGLLPLSVSDPKTTDDYNYGFAQTLPGIVRPRLNWEIVEITLDKLK